MLQIKSIFLQSVCLYGSKALVDIELFIVEVS